MKKKVIIGVVILIIIAIIVLVTTSGQKSEYTTFEVKKNTLKQSVDATGNIESAEKIELNFKISGRLASLLVEPGDEVNKGQRLAVLDAGALQGSVDDAYAQLRQAKADLERTLAGSSPEDIRVAENTVEQKLQELKTMENNLVSLKLKQETEIENLKDSVVTHLKNEISTAEGAMEEVDNTLTDDSAKNTLSVKNSSALLEAESKQLLADMCVTQMRTKINNLSYLVDDEIILKTIDEMRTCLDNISNTLSATLDVLAATVVSTTLSETELDMLKTNIKSKQTIINASHSNLQTVKSNWTNKIVYYEDLILASENSILAAERALETAISQLDLKKSTPRQFEIDAAKANVERAQASLVRAAANLADAIIVAPITGTVTKKNYNVGEQTSLNKPVLEMIGQSNLQIEVDISESDIAKIKVGQDTEISLDAFSEDVKFAGQVTFVDPAETIIQDVVYYKVKVQFNEFSNNIKPGMTADVNICTDKRENVLFVPSRAVKGTNGEKYVEVLENEKVVRKEVETGMRGDEGIEIASGLAEGELVITFVKE